MKTKMTKCIAMMITVLTMTMVCAPAAYAETYLKGDVNADGKVNLTDAKTSLRMALGIDPDTPEAIMYGDINGDGKLNLADVKEILRGALGITELGTGETDDTSDEADTPAVTNEPATEVTGGAVETCEHVWKDDVKTVTEEVTKDAWDEPVEVTEPVYICNQCDKVFGISEYGSSDAAGEEVLWHIFDGDTCANYRTEDRTYTYYVHHDAETTTVTKEVRNGVVCTKCGTHADKEPEQEASASDFKYGDVNADGSVNSSDALAILRHVVGIKTLDKTAYKAGDVDGDKDVTVCDALMILQYSVEIIVKFPAEAGETNTEDNPLTITDKAYICNYCGKEFKMSDYSTDELIDALIAHLSEELMKELEDTKCPENEHDWEYETETVTEDVLVKDAWDESVTESVAVCNGCDKIFSNAEYGSGTAATDAVIKHIALADFDSDCDSYHTEVRTFTIHHDAEYKTETVQKNISRTCSKCNKFEDLAK